MISAYRAVQNSHLLSGVAVVKNTTIASRVDKSSVVGAASQTVKISDEARKLAQSDAVYTMDTGAGKRPVDLASFFQPPTSSGASRLASTDSLLIPSSQNVQALSDHISSVFPQFLSDNNIPEAPEKISYDSFGEIVLPADYAYADELKIALEENPAMARELSTVNALSSHLASLKQLEPFHNEFAQANTDAQRDLIIAKYSYLLNDNRVHPEVSLAFSEGGTLTVNADDKALL